MPATRVPTVRRPVSAERAESRHEAATTRDEEPKTNLRAAISEHAADGALNAVAVMKESLHDFQKTDRFFKWKTAIIAAWVALSALGIAVASSGGGTSNSLDASMVRHGQRAEFLIRNEGDENWTRATVRVNGGFSYVEEDIVVPGGSIAFTPEQLVKGQQRAAKNYVVREVILEVDGDEAVLMKDGRVVD